MRASLSSKIQTKSESPPRLARMWYIHCFFGKLHNQAMVFFLKLWKWRRWACYPWCTTRTLYNAVLELYITQGGFSGCTSFSLFLHIWYSIFYSPCSSYSILHVCNCTFVFVLVCFLCLYLYLYPYFYLFLYLCLNSILHKGFSGCASFSLSLPPDCIQSQSQSHTIPYNPNQKFEIDLPRHRK